MEKVHNAFLEFEQFQNRAAWNLTPFSEGRFPATGECPALRTAVFV